MVLRESRAAGQVKRGHDRPAPAPHLRIPSIPFPPRALSAPAPRRHGIGRDGGERRGGGGGGAADRRRGRVCGRGGGAVHGGRGRRRVRALLRRRLHHGATEQRYMLCLHLHRLRSRPASLDDPSMIHHGWVGCLVGPIPSSVAGRRHACVRAGHLFDEMLRALVIMRL